MSRRFTLAVSISALLCSGIAFGQESDTLVPSEVLSSIKKKIDSIKSYSADMEVVEERDDGAKSQSSSTIVLSKDKGWRVSSNGKEGSYTFITNFDVFYQYYPDQKQVIKMIPMDAEASAMLKKPLEEINPITLMDAKGLNIKGSEQLNGETVYRIEGTTTTQVIPGVMPMTRKLEVWVNANDGFPRKTVENSGMSTATTTYKNLKINVPVTVEDFSFIVPPGVELIDANQEMKKMQQQTPPMN